MLLEVEYQKLEYARRGLEDLLRQHRLSPTQGHDPSSFAQEVVQILRKEIDELPSKVPSTIDSRSESTSPESTVPSPVTPPSTPPRQKDGNQVFDLEPEVEEISMPRQKLRRPRKTRSEPPVSLA